MTGSHPSSAPSPLVSARFRVLARLGALVVAVALTTSACQARPTSVSESPITPAAQVRSPLDDATLVAATVVREGGSLAATTVWTRGRRTLVADADGVRSAPQDSPAPTPEPAAPEEVEALVEALARYEETPEIGGAVVLPDGSRLVLVTAWRTGTGGYGTGLFRGLWQSAPASLTGWTPFAVPGADGSAITTLASAGPLVWVTTSDGRVVASSDGGASFSEVPVLPAPRRPADG